MLCFDSFLRLPIKRQHAIRAKYLATETCVMFSPTSLEDLALLCETVELECKLAQGQSGQGGVPKGYHLQGAAPASPEQVFALLDSSGSNDPSFGSNAVRSGSNGRDLVDIAATPAEAGFGQSRRDEHGWPSCRR